MNRREFFVKSGKIIIPTIGLLGLSFSASPRTARAAMSCGTSCSNGCGSSCDLNCSSSCEGFCKGGCSGTCKSGCEGFLRK